MSFSIDQGGRLVIPKAIRDRLGLKPGSQVDIVLRGGEISIVPVVPTQRLVRHGRSLYAESSSVVPKLDVAMVREVLESTRR